MRAWKSKESGFGAPALRRELVWDRTCDDAETADWLAEGACLRAPELPCTASRHPIPPQEEQPTIPEVRPSVVTTTYAADEQVPVPAAHQYQHQRARSRKSEVPLAVCRIPGASPAHARKGRPPDELASRLPHWPGGSHKPGGLERRGDERISTPRSAITRTELLAPLTPALPAFLWYRRGTRGAGLLGM